MEKIMQVTTSLPTGRVIHTKELTLDQFTVEHVIEFGERADYNVSGPNVVEFIKTLTPGNHRSVEKVNESLIVRYMDHYPQYYYKK